MISDKAVIDPSAKIAKNVTIEPFTVIGPNVEIGEGSWIASHVVIRRDTKIGKNNKIYQFASIGEDCQDKKYHGEKTYLEIGDNNIIRESVTIHRGTVQDKGITSIGNDNLLMAYVHIAHDCRIGDHTIFSNNASLAGHVHVHDHAILAGFSAVHQFCHVGAHSFLASGAIVIKDVPPYIKAAGQYAKPYGLNIEGLRRRGFEARTRRFLQRAYKAIYRENLRVEEAIIELEKMKKDCPEVELFITFLQNATRGIIR